MKIAGKPQGTSGTIFRTADPLSPDTDRLALVTMRGTNTLLEHFAGLLDCSRAARGGEEFLQRLTTTGFISGKVGRYCSELRTIVGAIEGRSVTTVEIWPFLRVLHVPSLDLTTSTRQTESQIKTLLAHTTGESDASGAADASWNELLALGDSRCIGWIYVGIPLPKATPPKSSPRPTSSLPGLRDTESGWTPKIRSRMSRKWLMRVPAG